MNNITHQFQNKTKLSKKMYLNQFHFFIGESDSQISNLLVYRKETMPRAANNGYVTAKMLQAIVCVHQFVCFFKVIKSI